MARKPTGGKPGRPSKAALAERARARLESGEAATIAEAIEGLPIGRSTAAAYLAADGAAPQRLVKLPPRAPAVEFAPAAGPGIVKVPAPPADAAPAIVAGTPLERLRAYAAHDAPALLALERMASPASLSDDPRSNVQRLLASLEADYVGALGTSKRGAFAEKMISALKELRQYFPPTKPAPPADLVLAAVQAQDVGCIAKIEEHLAAIERSAIAELAAPTNGAP